MPLGTVICQTCGKNFLKDIRHINENNKLGHKFYCSLNCQSSSKKKQQIELTCENPNCRKKFMRNSWEVSSRNFCSQECTGYFTALRNREYRRILKYCSCCGKRISPRSIYCSNHCSTRARQLPKEQLIKMLHKTTNQLGRSPTRREFRYYHSCISRFGSWNQALITAGLNPHRSLNQRMYRRRQCKALDGHICNSVSELIIDNWLYNHHIDHEKEVPYPEGKFTSDWGISPTIFVEYFGLANDSIRYDKEIKKKQEICQKYGINLIEVYPKDLFPEISLNRIFAQILK